jgi:hypothetical protein
MMSDWWAVFLLLLGCVFLSVGIWMEQGAMNCACCSEEVKGDECVFQVCEKCFEKTGFTMLEKWNTYWKAIENQVPIAWADPMRKAFETGYKAAKGAK